VAEQTLRYITRCPVGCEAPLVATTIELPEGVLLRCSACGQLVSQVAESRYRESMAAFDRAGFNQPQGRELARRNQVAKRRLRAISRMLGKAPGVLRVLDVGCSRGHFVAAAVDAGFHAEGVEPAPQIAAAARERGLVVHTGLLEEQHFPDGSFDALTLFEVIEHLREPCALLRECRRVLRPGGIVLLSTGNTASWTVSFMGARWDYFHISTDAGHVSFFHPGSIRKLAENCGFTVVSIETARVRFFERTDVSRALYTAGHIAAELLNPPARWLARGHDMLAYLRRPSAHASPRQSR
jgi:2-polyprenyl-3-methyl-5-hydroxy-6-metoxy-1,4-benzoquinol methylase